MSAQSGTQESALMTIKASGTWEFGFSSAVKLDMLEAVEAPDAEKDAAPAEVDMAVGALMGCTCTLVQSIAREMDFRHSGIDFAGEAKFSIDNLSGSNSAVRRFKAIRGTVQVRTDESRERLDGLAAEVRRQCGVLDTLEKAGIACDIQWSAINPGG